MTPLVVLLAQFALAGSVTMDGARWKGLLPPEDDPEEDAPGPSVWWRDLTLQPAEEEISFDATWRLSSSEAVWWEGVLAGPGVEIRSATWNGNRATLATSPQGTSITGRIDGSVRLVVTGVIGGDATRGAVEIPLLGAAAGHVDVHTDAKPILTANEALVAMNGGAWSGASRVQLKVEPRGESGPKPTLMIARSGLGVTVGDGVLDVRGRARWSVLQGAVERVSFSVPGAGKDLSVEGPLVSEWNRSGDRVDVVLREPSSAAVDIEVHWTSGFAAEEAVRVASPTMLPDGAFRTEYSLQLARDGEREVVPDLTGWGGIASSELPGWGSGLVRGAPTAAYGATSPPAGHLDLFQFTIVSGPPTIVDVAAYTVAATEEGRTLIRAHYAVRNERGAFLRVIPPPETTILGARVAGETARVASDGRGWLIPLDKSLETVEGLLSFPVEVIFLGDDVDWARREVRELSMPTVDAPVAASQTTIYLPPGYENRLESGESDVVDDFSAGEGITYGSGFGDVGNATADALFQSAVSNYMGNNFEAVADDLAELEQMGAFNENVQRLQANMAVLDGSEADGKNDDSTVLARRVRSQAQARSGGDRQDQEDAVQQAEKDYLSGNYAEAEGNYKKALDIGKRLSKLEQSESKEEDFRNEDFKKRLDEVSKQKERRKSEENSRSRDSDGDGILDQNDQCPDDPEVSNNYLDDDGCPDQPPALVKITKDQIVIHEPEMEPEPEPESKNEPVAASPKPVSISGELERSARATDEEKYRYGAASLAEMRQATQAMGTRSRGEGAEEVQCKTVRATSAAALLQVAAAAASQMQASLGAGDADRADHEFRKIVVAVAKTRLLLAEWQQCTGDLGVESGITYLTIVDEDDGESKFAGFGPLEDERRSAEPVRLQRRTKAEKAREAAAGATVATVDPAPPPDAVAKAPKDKGGGGGGKMRSFSERPTTSFEQTDISLEDIEEIVGTAKTKEVKAGKGRKTGMKPPANTPAPEEISVSIGGEFDKAPDVKAAQLSVIVPSRGERVRYQHLLLPADGVLTVHIDAKLKR